MFYVINRCDDSRYPFTVVQAASENEACCAVAAVVAGNEYHGKYCLGSYTSESEAVAACNAANDCELA